MKLNNKGWGTTQMFLLSGGLLLALLVAIFFISVLYGSIDNSIKNREYMDIETKISSAAKEYVINRNVNISNELRIHLDTLRTYGFIDELKDEKGNNCDGYVVVSKIDLVNNYKAYISCPGYKTDNY